MKRLVADLIADPLMAILVACFIAEVTYAVYDTCM